MAKPTAPPHHRTAASAYTVQFAQLSLVDGVWQDQPDPIGLFDADRLGAHSGEYLFVVVDVSGETEGRAGVERELVETVRRAFVNARGSLAGRLSEALRAANSYLHDLNLHLSRDERRMAGVSTVALRGGELAVAQTGPALVYLVNAGELQQFPVSSPWLEEDAPPFGPGQAASSPLGAFKEIIPETAGASVEAGDAMILCMRALAQLVTPEELQTGLVEKDAAELGTELESIIEDTDVAALIVRLAPAPEPALEHEPEPPRKKADLTAPVLPVQATPAPEVSPAPVPPPLEVAPSAPAHVAPEPRPEPPIVETPLPARPATAAPPPAAAQSSPSDPSRGVPIEPDPNAPRIVPRRVIRVIVPPAPLVEGEPPHAEWDDEPEEAEVAPESEPAYAEDEGDTEEDEFAAQERLEQLRAERAARREQQVQGLRYVLLTPIAYFWRALAGLLRWTDTTSTQLGRNKSLQRAGSQGNRTLNAVVAFIGRVLRAIVRLLLPGVPERERSAPRRASTQPLWLKVVALALPIAFVALALTMYARQLQVRQNQFKDMVTQVTQLVDDAERESDKTVKRDKLNQAAQLLDQARRMNETQETRRLYYRIQDQMNVANGIAVILGITEVARYTQATANAAQIIAHGSDLYVLDRGTKSVYHYVVNEVGTEAKPASGDGLLLKSGTAIGDKTVGDIADIVWADPGGNLPLGTLVIVDGSGQIILWDPTDTKKPSLAVPDTKPWGETPAAAAYSGNLYLLARSKNQILKFTPTDKGYTLASTNYFPGPAVVDLSRGIDLAIDSDVWVLRSDGTILRFRSGTAATYTLSGLDTPMKPGAFYTSPNTLSLYVADTGNQRIVQFDKSGKFVRQFKPEASGADSFKNIKSMVVDELRSKVYFINDNSAFMANVPR